MLIGLKLCCKGYWKEYLRECKQIDHPVPDVCRQGNPCLNCERQAGLLFRLKTKMREKLKIKNKNSPPGEEEWIRQLAETRWSKKLPTSSLYFPQIFQQFLNSFMFSLVFDFCIGKNFLKFRFIADNIKNR